MKRLYYKTAYDTNNTICGYVIPVKETERTIYLNRKQYNRALKNRTIGGTAGLIFDTDKYVLVEGIDFPNGEI